MQGFVFLKGDMIKYKEIRKEKLIGLLGKKKRYLNGVLLCMGSMEDMRA